MIPETHYCSYTATLPDGHPDKLYHDTVYGFPVNDDALLFERLILEINQAGLNWSMILRKQEHFRNAYDHFDPEKVAAYTDADRERLRADPGIIRNRLKINAAIYNAGRILEIRDGFGSFHDWLISHHPLPAEAWTKLFRKNFKFTGPEIVGEFLMSTGFLAGAHHPECPIYSTLRTHHPRPVFLL